MKRFGKKGWILFGTILAASALVGTGIAGWVVTANAQKTATGNITAYAVADQRMTIGEVKFFDSESATEAGADAGTFILGRPSGSTTTSTTPWLTADSKVKEEKLTQYVKFTVTSTDKSSPEVKISLAVGTDTTDKDLEKCLKNQYIKLPASYDYKKDVTHDDGLRVTHDDQSTDYTFVAKISLAWGEHFNKENPYTFYNSYGVAGTFGSTTYGDDAVAALGELEKANSATFALTITASHTTAA